LDLHYKTGADTDYCAKFRCGDWLAELVDLVVNLKKNITTKTYGLPELPFRAT